MPADSTAQTLPRKQAAPAARDADAGHRRLDKWLWYGRFFKSRSLAARHCAGGRMRVNRQPVRKAHHSVRVGDVLTFPQGQRIRVLRVLGLGSRRGPAAEARTLYDDLLPPERQPRATGVPVPLRQSSDRDKRAARVDARARRRLSRDA